MSAWLHYPPSGAIDDNRFGPADSRVFGYLNIAKTFICVHDHALGLTFVEFHSRVKMGVNLIFLGHLDMYNQ